MDRKKRETTKDEKEKIFQIPYNCIPAAPKNIVNLKKDVMQKFNCIQSFSFILLSRAISLEL
jgi:hypothetical protein